jgi:hypothetical protein
MTSKARDLTLVFMMLPSLLQLMFKGLRPRMHRWRKSSKVEKHYLMQA